MSLSAFYYEVFAKGFINDTTSLEMLYNGIYEDRAVQFHSQFHKFNFTTTVNVKLRYDFADSIGL